ncbi:MAG: hypothetical protein K0U59_09195 [Gammaproteobacteria bacterium]|nr:hypothetical protein [Gammaproteobacteria bacterium]
MSKSNEWVDGRESSRLFHSEHKDVAINQMFEANTRDIEQRIQLLQCPLNAKGHPQVQRVTEEALLADVSNADPDELPPEHPVEIPPQKPPELEPSSTPEWEPPSQPEGDPNSQPEIVPSQSLKT